jgi:hypothetical protein
MKSEIRFTIEIVSSEVRMKLNLRVKMFPWCRFVWGRTRLPRSIADFRGRDFVLQVRTTRASPVADWIKVSRR